MDWGKRPHIFTDSKRSGGPTQRVVREKRFRLDPLQKNEISIFPCMSPGRNLIIGTGVRPGGQRGNGNGGTKWKISQNENGGNENENRLANENGDGKCKIPPRFHLRGDSIFRYSHFRFLQNLTFSFFHFPIFISPADPIWTDPGADK